MATIPSEIRKAFMDYRKSVDLAAETGVLLLVAEREFEAIVNSGDEDRIDGARQHLTAATVEDLNAQYGMMKERTTLEALVQLAKSGIFND